MDWKVFEQRDIPVEEPGTHHCIFSCIAKPGATRSCSGPGCSWGSKGAGREPRLLLMRVAYRRNQVRTIGRVASKPDHIRSIVGQVGTATLQIRSALCDGDARDLPSTRHYAFRKI